MVYPSYVIVLRISSKNANFSKHSQCNEDLTFSGNQIVPKSRETKTNDMKIKNLFYLLQKREN